MTTVGKLTTPEMTEMMIGARHVPMAMPRAPARLGPQRLAVRGLQALNDRGVLALRDVNLTLHASEIVGIAGVSGNWVVKSIAGGGGLGNVSCLETEGLVFVLTQWGGGGWGGWIYNCPPSPRRASAHQWLVRLRCSHAN